MSSQNEILENIKRNVQKIEKVAMPDLSSLNFIKFENKVEKYLEMIAAVGGKGIVLEKGEDLNLKIKELYPDAKRIASNISEITIATENPDSFETPHELNGVDLAVIKGDFAVAENAAIWVPSRLKHKALHFISEYLVILINKSDIVNNMHEAYDLVAKAEDNGFNFKSSAGFISGPSKTADIEQSLVVGAHGPRGVTVIIL